METAIVMLLAALIAGLGTLSISLWQQLREEVSDHQESQRLLWEIARSQRQYAPSGTTYIVAKDRLADRIDDHIGYDEMGD